jgi:hypothetical protein
VVRECRGIQALGFSGISVRVQGARVGCLERASAGASFGCLARGLDAPVSEEIGARARPQPTHTHHPAPTTDAPCPRAR